MIGKITKGNGFAGVCSYILDKDEARLIGGNMASTTPRQLAAEFRVFSQKNQRVQLPVEHISLSPSPGDRELDDGEWQTLASGQYISNIDEVLATVNTEFNDRSRISASVPAQRKNCPTPRL
jgi:hypothetical protein